MRGSPGRSVQLRWLPPLGFVIPLFAGALLVGPMSGQAAPEDRALAQWIEEQRRQDESLAGDAGDCACAAGSRGPIREGATVQPEDPV